MRLVVYTMHGVTNLTQAAAVLNKTGAVRALVQVEICHTATHDYTRAGLPMTRHNCQANALLRFEDYPAYCYFCEKTNQTPMTTKEYFS